MNYTTSSNTTLAPAKYNGNIAEVLWKSVKDGIQRNYLYDYDALNRLKTANFRTPSAANPETDFYNESLTYDVNGNITALQRYSRPLSGTTALKIDQLTYTYTGNQLTKVADATGNESGYPYLVTPDAIMYDANGNMTKQMDKGISNIEYNFLNLPTKIVHPIYYRLKVNPSLNYLYRADGVKVKKISMNNEIVDYLDGFQYVSEGASLNEFGDVINPIAPNPILQFVPTSEGYYDFTKNSYIYNYVDHLGNVRLSYADSNKNGVIDPSTEIIEENNYYPFGLKHEGYNSLVGNPKYQYKYNGKELQETGMYDYGARFYMPDIGKFGTHDPLGDATFQPYNYANNNPIFYNDPTGMVGEAFASVGVTKNKKGEYEIVSAKNDGDFGIYIADSNGNYDIKKSQRVGTLNNSFDFLFTDDSTGKFIEWNSKKNDKYSSIELNPSLNLMALLYKYGYNTDNDIDNYYLDLIKLAYMSANYDGKKGTLDLKSSLGLGKYTPVFAGKNYTSLRAASNILFGFNMRKIYEKYKNKSEFREEFRNAESFYSYAMQAVGGYNQYQNHGAGYNKGFPFFGEHTYSGANIYRGYFHQYTNQKLSRGK